MRLCLALVFAASTAHAQTTSELIARGDSLWEALQPEASLGPYGDVVRTDPQLVEAWWKYARSQVDVAKQLEGDDFRERRDSIYGVARAYAQSALNFAPDDAEARFVMALVLGRQSLTRGGRERVQYAREIYEAAAGALEIDPEHAGAWHILGAWHAEVRRLSGFTRFLAKTLFGAGFLGRAEWDSAAVYLERAVALEPAYIFHRLELAEIYVDMDRVDDALVQLEAIEPLNPEGDVLDPSYKARAAAMYRELRSSRNGQSDAG